MRLQRPETIRISPGLLRSIAIGYALFALGAAHAGPASQQSISMPVSVDHESNATLSGTDETPVTRWRWSPSFESRWWVDAHEFSINLGALIERSSDEEVSQDRNDPKVDAVWQWASALDSVRARATLQQASARTTALEETGQVVAEATRSTRALSAAWNHALDDLDSVGVDVSIQSVAFTRQVQADFLSTSVSARYARRFSELMDGSFSLQFSRYRPDTSDAFPLAESSRTNSLSLGLRRQLTAQTELQGQLGALYIPGTRLRPDSTGTWQGSIRLGHQGDRLNTGFEFARAATVDNQSGGYSVNDAFRVQGTYALTENTSVGLQAAHQRTDGSQASTAQSVGVNVYYQLSEPWRFSVNVQHRRASRTGQPDASSNLVGAQLLYADPHL